MKIYRLSKTVIGLSLTCALLMTMLLQGCGGGGVAGSASGVGTPLTSGTVTGFGSVVVDGVEIEDAKALVQADQLDGSSSNTTLQLGQRVRVAHDGKGTASKVTVDAAVIGVVSVLPTLASPTTLTVAAQIVRINTTDTSLPITYFGGGYSLLSDVALSDVVEIHGSPVYNSTTAKYEVQATRIQKQTGIASIRVMGVVASLDATAKTFALNGLTVNYTSATLQPSTSSLANGQTVVAFANTSAALSGTTLTASRVRIYTGSETLPSNSVVQVSGVVNSYSVLAGTFSVQGQTVKIGSVTPVPAGSSIANNAYVRVEGSLNATTGNIDATTVRVRESSTNSDLAKIRLIGPIGSYDGTSATMVVRTVPVDIGSSALVNTCTSTLADGLVVTVEAVQQAGTDVVLAKSISCALPVGIVIESFLGQPSTINTATKTFTLTVTSSANVVSTKSVQWTDLTAFQGVSAGTLASITTATLMVEGYTSSGVLVARGIRVLGAADGDRFLGANKNTSRTDYRSGHAR